MKNSFFDNYIFDEEMEVVMEDEIEEVAEEEAATIVDDGEGNFKLNIPEDPKVVLEKNKAEAENKAKEEQEKEKKKAKPKAKDKIKVNPVKEKRKTKEEEIEEQFKDYEKIYVKVFGSVEYEYTNPEEIKMLKLDEITNSLIIEKDYEEFSNGVNWSLVKGKEETTGYLIPTYKFHPKG